MPQNPIDDKSTLDQVMTSLPCTWPKVDQDLCCHMASLGHNELNLQWIFTWISNHIHIKLWDVITQPCPNYNGCLTKPIVELVLGWVIHISKETIGVITYPYLISGKLFTKYLDKDAPGSYFWQGVRIMPDMSGIFCKQNVWQFSSNFVYVTSDICLAREK